MSSNPARWPPGSQIALRFRNTGRLSWVSAATVVEDSPDLIALFMPPGTPLNVRVKLDGTPFPRALPYVERRKIPWRLGDGIWGERSVLWVTRPGQAYAIGMFWHESETRFLGWYVNLQAPLLRSLIGFDTIDHILDIEVAPDRSWRWKDEDEFADALRFGRFTAGEGARIRAAGEAAVTEIERIAWPFDTAWDGWQPGAGWPISASPADREAS